MKTTNGRTTQYNIDDQFLKRHSPRALSGETITKDEIMTLFEAARWAPSSYNIQPWRFIYAMRGTPEFETMMSFLGDFNKSWCVNASALVVTVSANTSMSPSGEVKDNNCHSFDTGSAWENLALQASETGFIAHGMSGFDYAMAKEKLGVPADHSVEMMIAIGKPGKIESIPEGIRGMETPNDRNPLEKMVMEGKFIAQ